MFLSEHRGTVIEDVLKMEWDTTCCNVPARPMDAISFRKKGDCILSDGNSEFVLKSGDILFLPRQKPYKIDTKSESITVVHFNLGGEPMPQTEKFSLKDCAAAEMIFDEMYNVWNGKEIGYYHRTLSLLYSLFELLEKQEACDIQSEKMQILRPSIDYMNEHFADADFSVKEMERRCYYSEAYFRRLFFQCFGEAPVEYVLSKRIKLACAYLRAGNHSVKTVAEKCGFSDSKYFAVLFKKRMGQSPLKYKKSH